MLRSNKKAASPFSSISSPASAGFTLIEVLIGLTLLVIVLGAVYSSFFSVQNALERFDSVSLKYHEARSTLDIMRREIESAVLKIAEQEGNPLTGTEFVIKDRDVFGRPASSLELTAYSFKGHLNRVSYYTAVNDGRMDLFKKQAPHMMQSNEYTLQLIEGVESFTIETLFHSNWVKTWDSNNTEQLPETIRITVEFLDNGRSVKLTEYAKPRVGRNL